MKIIKGVRGSGKTYELLKESNNSEIPILCRNNSQKKLLQMMSGVYQIPIPPPILINELEQLGITNVLVDELIPTIESALGIKISGYSETLGDREDNIVLELNKQYGERHNED